MKVISEMSLISFEFWGGAKDRAKMPTYEELEEIGNVLEDIYEEEVEDVTINDSFWFDFAWCCECIGIKYNEEEDIIIREEESEEE